MNELLISFGELLPDDPFWRTVCLVVLLVVFVRYPLVWLGRSIRYTGYWYSCRVRGRCILETSQIKTNLYGQAMGGSGICAVCKNIRNF